VIGLAEFAVWTAMAVLPAAVLAVLGSAVVTNSSGTCR